MNTLNIKKAPLLKRFSSFLFDFILLVLLSAVFIWLVSLVTDYNYYNTRLIDDYTLYEEKHLVDFSITSDEYNTYSDNERASYDRAYEDLLSDIGAVSDYRRVIFLTFFNLLVGVFTAYLILEVLVPILFKDGVTLGKKIFSLKVMKKSGDILNVPSLLLRTIVGKYLLETALPLFFFLYSLFSYSLFIAPVAILIVLVINIALVSFSSLHSALHDIIACTVVVDSDEAETMWTEEM